MNTARACSCLRAALLAVLMLWAGRAPAVPDSWNPAQALADASWSWADAQTFDLPGAHLRMQRFRARLALADAARQLNRAGVRRFSRLQLVGSGLLLSGGWQGQHWLAQLQPERDGTTGLVSSLSPRQPQAQDFDAASYVPAGARQVLQVSGRSADAPGTLASFDCPGTLAEVAASVYRALRVAHWQTADPVAPPSRVPGGPASGSAAPDSRGSGRPQSGPSATPAPLLAQWRSPDGSQLTVHLVPRARTVALIFWHRPAGQP